MHNFVFSHFWETQGHIHGNHYQFSEILISCSPCLYLCCGRDAVEYADV